MRVLRCPRLEEISEDEPWFDGDSWLWLVGVGHFNLLGVKPFWCRGGSLNLWRWEAFFLFFFFECLKEWFSWDDGELWLLLFVLAFFTPQLHHWSSFIGFLQNRAVKSRWRNFLSFGIWNHSSSTAVSRLILFLNVSVVDWWLLLVDWWLLLVDWW